VAELARGLGLDVADTLAGDIELLADFFLSVLGVMSMPKRMRSTLASREVKLASDMSRKKPCGSAA